MVQSLSGIGPIMQLAFVPENFDQAVHHWTKVMGVGPFYFTTHAGLSNVIFEGQPTEADFGLAIGYWEDIQIELIKPNNDAPSIFTTSPWTTSGLHHICVATRNFETALSRFDLRGAKTIMSGEQPGGKRVVYADTGGQQGLVEVLEISDQLVDLFHMIKQASNNWDGTDPLRSLG